MHQAISREQTIELLLNSVLLGVNQNGEPVFIHKSNGVHQICVKPGTKKSHALIRQILTKSGMVVLKSDLLRELEEILEAMCHDSDLVVLERQRIDRRFDENGNIVVELFSGDERDLRTIVSSQGVTVTETDSLCVFRKTDHMKPYPVVGNEGDVKRLWSYLNMRTTDKILLIAWITYTLAHPKVSSTNYVVLQLVGGQGTGKSTLSTVLQRLIDPSAIHLRSFPENVKDLAVAVNNSHLVMFDNMRSISRNMSDKLCICATGGSISGRKLYTDASESNIQLHGAMVLNAITPVVVEPDLLDRTLTIELQQLEDRKSQAQLMAKLDEDMPIIFRGLLDLISDILRVLPDVKVTYPARMIEFSEWLAAYEKVTGCPEGSYQQEFLMSQKESKELGMHQSPLLAAILTFAEKEEFWNGSASNLLKSLEEHAGFRHHRSADWPKNPISLSMKLKALIGPLKEQGVTVVIGRNTDRYIEINKD